MGPIIRFSTKNDLNFEMLGSTHGYEYLLICHLLLLVLLIADGYEALQSGIIDRTTVAPAEWSASHLSISSDT